MPLRRSSRTYGSRKNGPRRQRRTHPSQNRRRRSTRRVRRRMSMPRRRKIRRRAKNRVEFGNIKTHTQQFADSETISPPPTGSGFDTFGMAAAYLTVGTGQNQSYPETRPLMGWQDLANLADSIRAQESPAIGQQLPGTFAQTKYRIIDCHQKFELINSSNGQCYIDMYYVKARHDIIFGNNYGNLPVVMANGLAQRGVGTGTPTATTLLDYQLTPFDSTKFCQQFHIYKTERVVLDPGVSCVRIIRNGTRYIDWSRYATFTGTQINPVYNRDYSHIQGEKTIMFKIYGTPATAALSSGGANFGAVTYTYPKINMITTNHYNYQSVNPQQPILVRAPPVGFSNVPSGGAVQIVNDENGVISEFQDA